MTFLAPADQLCISMSHTVELNVYLLTFFGFSIKMNSLDGDSQEEIDDFKRSEEYITFDIASELLSNCEVNHLLFVVTFYSDSFFFWKLNSLLTTKLQQYLVLSFYEAVDKFLIQVSIVESKKESSWDWSN